MGAKPKIGEPPLARAVVHNLDPDDPVRAIVFVKDGEEVNTAYGSGKSSLEAVWRDEGFTPGKHYYYVRVEFQSGNTAFSSPVFVNY